MIWLIFGHYMGDFAFQSEWISAFKGIYRYIMFVHSMIWTACICLALKYTGDLATWKIYFLIMGHCFIDQCTWNQRQSNSKEQGPTLSFYVDQVFHLVQCAIVYNF